MTKTLKTLIKLHKNRLDKILKEVEFHEKEKLRTVEKKLLIQQEMNLEIENYSASEFSFVLEKYVENTRKLLKQLEYQITRLDTIIARLRNNLKDQYSELKKFEIALSNKKLLEHEKIKKDEAKLLDEFNINNFAGSNKLR